MVAFGFDVVLFHHLLLTQYKNMALNWWWAIWHEFLHVMYWFIVIIISTSFKVNHLLWLLSCYYCKWLECNSNASPFRPQKGVNMINRTVLNRQYMCLLHLTDHLFWKQTNPINKCVKREMKTVIVKSLLREISTDLCLMRFCFTYVSKHIITS